MIGTLFAEPPPTALIENEVFFDIDLLIWDAREEGLEYAYKNTATQTNQKLNSFEPRSKFEPGFRLTFGGHLPYDHWTLKALYTFYHTKRRASAKENFDQTSAPGPGMIAVWTYPSAFSNNNTGARFTTADNLWQLHASVLDLALSRPCEISPFFTAVPFFAIRSAWIHQYYKASYGDGNLILFGASNQVTVLSSAINMNCSSDNVGPAFGCTCKWLLGKHWDLFSNVSGALIGSYFDVRRRETDLFLDLTDALVIESIRIKNKYWTFRPQGQMALGISFSDRFHYGRRSVFYHVSAAYEAEIWWKQNQLLRYLDILNANSSGTNVTPTQGDLMFHGVNLEAGVDF